MTKLLLSATANSAGVRKLRILAYAGNVITVPGWGRVVIEIAGCDCSARVPLLGDHENELGSVVGHGTPSTPGGARITLAAELVKGDAGDGAGQLLTDGTPLGASVGVEVLAWEYVPAGKTIQANGRTIKADAPFKLITRSKLREVSLTPVAADADSSVAIAARAAAPNGDLMPEQTMITDANTATDTLPDHPAELVARIERLEAAAKLNAQRASAPRAPAYASPIDDGPTAHDVAVAAYLQGGGRGNVATKECTPECVRAASRMRIRSIPDLCAYALKANGADVPCDMHRLLQAASALKASVSSIDVSNIVSDAIQKVARNVDVAQTSAWQQVCDQTSQSTYHPQKRIGVTTGLPYSIVAPGGQIVHNTLQDDLATVTPDLWATMLELSEHTLRNDNGGLLLSQLPNAIARDGARAVADRFASVLLAGTDESGAEFFTDARGNRLAGADTAFSYEAVSAAIAAMRSMTDSAGKLLDIVPAYVLGPPSLEIPMRALCTSLTVLPYVGESTGTLPQGNPLKDRITPVVEGRLPLVAYGKGASETAWYLLSTQTSGAIVASFLDGQSSRMIETETSDFDSFGWRIRGSIRFGGALCDWHAAIMCTGVAD
jgi:hypothetical protein